MSRKFSILVVFCIVLFGAILAGYWDMLDSEKLRAIRERATASVAEFTGQVPEPSAEPAPPPAAAPAAPDATPKPAPGAEPEKPPADATKEAAAPAATTDAPSFDLLRVEPDGSAVIAGRAHANGEVRLMDGDRTIGRAKANADGDFAVVLDERLPAGNHQIRIESSSAEGASASSTETAIVSVPKPGEDKELLAMIEAPDKPSRIITLPKGEPPVASAAPSAVPAPSNEGAVPGAAPGETASRAPEPEPDPLPANVPPQPFAVEAVEIENGNVFIAGRAPGSDPVRAYIDDRSVGEDRRRLGGRFLVTAKAPVATGDHRIRVDMIGPDGKVALRVEVPFARPASDSMSAVASNAGPAAPTSQAESRVEDQPSSDAGPSTAAAPAAPAPVAPAEGGAGEVATVVQPALEGVHGRVMIRRGDTLWRISRQTYGQGRRYTVIYLANGDQIRNPNRIYPGQVFRLPKGEDGATTATP